MIKGDIFVYEKLTKVDLTILEEGKTKEQVCKDVIPLKKKEEKEEETILT